MQRTLAVLAWLAVHERTTVDELADRFGVTPKQMQIDLELATMSGYGPDPSEAGNMLGFYIEDDGTVEAYALKSDLVGPTRLTRAEAFAVLTAGRAALDLEPTLDALRSAMGKLAGALGVDMDEVVDVDLGAPECLDDFRVAEREHSRLRIGYWTASRDEVTERDVDPLYVFFRDGAWYARCIDHLERAAGARRMFRLDRVTSCRPTGEHFEPPPTIDTSDDVFDPDADSQPVTLRFPAGARWVLDYLEIREVQDDGDPAGPFTGVLDVVGLAFLDQWLVRTRATVLDPPELRGRTAVAAKAILARYP